ARVGRRRGEWQRARESRARRSAPQGGRYAAAGSARDPCPRRARARREALTEAARLRPPWGAVSARTEASIPSSARDGLQVLGATPCAQAFFARSRLDRVEHAVGRGRELVQAQADRVVDRVGERGSEAVQRAFARFLGAEWTEWIVRLDELDVDGWCVGAGRDAVVEHAGVQR